MFAWTLPLPSADAVWNVVSSPVPFGRALEDLGEAETQQVRAAVLDGLDEYRGDGGGFEFPFACRRFWGRK